MKTKFKSYLEKHNLEIYDVAKMLRDSDWNQNIANYRTREAFVRLLYSLDYSDWKMIKIKGGSKVPGLYNEFDGAITAWRIAQIIGCDVEEIV